MSESDRQEEASPDPEPGDAPIDAEFEPAADDPPRPARGPGWISLILVLILATSGGALGGAVLARAAAPPLPVPGPVSAPDADDLDDLRATVSDLSGRIETQSARLQDFETTAVLEADLNRRFGQIEARLDALSDTLDALDPAAVPPSADGSDAGAGEDTSGLRARLRALGNQAERTETQLADVDSRVESQDRRIDRLAQTLEQVSGTLSGLRDDLATMEPADTDLGERVETLSTRVERLETRLDEGLGELTGRIETVRATGLAAAEASRAAMALAEIEAAARRGQGFQPAWRDLSAIRPEDPAVSALESLALEGAPTRETLARRLETLEETVRAAEQAEAGGAEGLVERLSGGQIQIRRDGETAPDVALETARTALAAGDLGGAIGAMQGLTGPARDVASSWIEEARRRRDLERAIDRLRLTLMREEGPADP